MKQIHLSPAFFTTRPGEAGRFTYHQGLPMKRYSLLLLPLVAVVFAVSCRDSTSPAGSHALLAPRNPDLGVTGNKPPPPVDAVIDISINSPSHAIFTGVFFNNGKISDVGEPVETFDGTAWLRLDNQQPTPFGTASPNMRFMVKDMDPPTAAGTLSFLEGANVVTYRIVKMLDFTRFNSCGTSGFPTSPCAVISFIAEDVNGPPCNLDDPLNANGGCHDGNAAAFDKASCLSFNGDNYYIPENCSVGSIEP